MYATMYIELVVDLGLAGEGDNTIADLWRGMQGAVPSYKLQIQIIKSRTYSITYNRK